MPVDDGDGEDAADARGDGEAFVGPAADGVAVGSDFGLIAGAVVASDVDVSIGVGAAACFGATAADEVGKAPLFPEQPENGRAKTIVAIKGA